MIIKAYNLKLSIGVPDNIIGQAMLLELYSTLHRLWEFQSLYRVIKTQ